MSDLDMNNDLNNMDQTEGFMQGNNTDNSVSRDDMSNGQADLTGTEVNEITRVPSATLTEAGNGVDQNRTTQAPTGGVYSARHYDYTASDNRATYSNGVYYSRPDAQSSASNMHREQHSDNEGMYGADKPHKAQKNGAGRVIGRVLGVAGLGIVLGLAASVSFFAFNKVTATHESTTPVIEQAESLNNETPEKSIPEVITNVEDKVNTVADGSEGYELGKTVVTDVSDVVDAAMPSIVSIIGKYVITGQSFWGQTISQEATGKGSGIIIGQEGDRLYIATNNHVVENSETLSVQFIDGESAEAVIKGTDADVDLAVITVDINDLSESTKNAIKIAKLGDSDSIKIGEPAIVIGNSLGYGQTVTYGVISAVDRTLSLSDGTESKGLIQTDAAINSGNSGGALLNINGEVMGISSSKIGGAAVDGVGFAIPISKAEPILNDMVENAERVKIAESKQGYLGISGQTVTDEVSQIYGLPVGVLVRKVYEDTGAYESGLEQGDVILEVAGKTIASMEELREELEYHEVGETVDVKVGRLTDGDYTDVTVSVKLVEKDALQ